MNKKDQARFDKLMEEARDAACQAAEAMDRDDLEEWNKLQDRAEALRDNAKKIGVKKSAAKKSRGKAVGGPRRTKR